jgi:hypothetical protein
MYWGVINVTPETHLTLIVSFADIPLLLEGNGF